MGNQFFVHNSKKGFEKTEGIVFAIFAGVLVIAGLTVLILMGIKYCQCTCKSKREKGTSKNGTAPTGITQTETSQTGISEGSTDNKVQRKSTCIGYLHGGLQVIFPRLMETKVNSDNSELFLIAGRKPNTDKKCSTICTYVYLSLMGFLIVLWFLVVLVDSLIYRKTTTCNDINVDDDSYVCFDLNNKWEIVDCLSDQRSKNVFCYLYTISPSAFGIAFSVASLISTLVSVSFYAAVFLSDTKSSQYILIVFQMLVIFLFAIGITALGVMYAFQLWPSFFFFFFDGRSPMRIFLFVLGVASLVLGLCTPWCSLKEDKPYRYRDVASKLEEGEFKQKDHHTQTMSQEGDAPKSAAGQDHSNEKTHLLPHSNEKAGECDSKDKKRRSYQATPKRLFTTTV